MKDPLDDRDDPYSRFNEEAKLQGLKQRLTFNSKPMEIRRLFGALQLRCKNRALLQQAYDRLTQVERRLETDMSLYWLDGQDEPKREIPQPHSEWDDKTVCPDMEIDASFFQIMTKSEEDWLEPIEFRVISVTAMNRYDSKPEHSVKIEFEK